MWETIVRMTIVCSTPSLASPATPGNLTLQQNRNRVLSAGASVAVSQPDGHWKALEKLLFAAGAQAAIQLLGFLSGLLVLRWLPIREYAYYTIANAALGTMTVLTDTGVAQSVMAQGGRVWQSRSALGAVISSGMALRRRFAVAAVIVLMPVLYFMLRRQGATTVTSVLVAASILPLFVSSLTGQVLQIVPKLHQRLTSLQTILLSAAGLRLALVTAAAALFPLAWLVSACAGVAQNWANWRLRSLAGQLADLDATPDPGAWATAMRQVRRTAPSAIYYAFEGQISVWLISIFGKTQAIAQVGALGRLAMIFNIVSALLALLWAPSFARLQAGPEVLHRFWFVQLGLLGFVIAVVAGVAWSPSAALALLGRDYGSLTHEVVLAAAGGGAALLAGCAYVMASSRAVVLTPWVVVPASLILQGSLILSLPISTVSGVLWLAILTNLAFWLMHACNFTRIALKYR
jgi:hypothetical protein